MFYKYYFFKFHKMKFQFYFTFLYKMISNNFIRQGNTNWNLERKYIYRHFVYFIKFLGTSRFSISLVYLQKQTFTRLKFPLCTTCPTFLEFFKFDVSYSFFLLTIKNTFANKNAYLCICRFISFSTYFCKKKHKIGICEGER